MALTHETTIIQPGYVVGDMKMVTYNITFTLHQLLAPETGWLLLNGATITSGAYPILFARFGATLPDLTDGKVPTPKGLGTLTTWAATGGEINHTLTTAELAAHAHSDNFTATELSPHSHTGSGSTNAASGAHTHQYTSLLTAGGAGSGGGLSGDTPNVNNASTSAANSHTHNATASINTASAGSITPTGGVSNTGSGTAHNNMQPYLVMGGWLVRSG